MATARRHASGVSGFAHVDRRTKNLVRRLQPGDIAVVDHDDLDRVAAENLVLAKVAAVVNAGRFITGRYPNVGPLLLAAAGIVLIDETGVDVMDAIAEGDLLRIDGERVLRGDEVVAKGKVHTLQSLEAQLEAAKQVMGEELERFAENTLEYLRRERHLLTDSPNLPELTVDLRGRHVLVVVRGFDYRQDLSILRSYIKEVRPVLVGVDGGADALLEFRMKPDVIIGDFDSSPTGPSAAVRSWLCTHTAAVTHRVRRASSASGARTRSSRARAPARTSPCSSRTRRGPSSSLPSAPMPRWSSSSTRAGGAWLRRSSPA